MTADEFEQFITRMLVLLRREDESLWDQGDLLYAQRLDNAGMHKASERLSRSVSTLRKRLKVCTEFQSGTAIPRITSVPFTVYEQLARIGDADLRLRVWGSRPPEEWTYQAMRNAVTAALPTQPVVSRRTRVFSFEGYKLVLEVMDDGLQVTVESPFPLTDEVESQRMDVAKYWMRFTRDDL